MFTQALVETPVKYFGTDISDEMKKECSPADK